MSKTECNKALKYLDAIIFIAEKLEMSETDAIKQLAIDVSNLLSKENDEKKNNS